MTSRNSNLTTSSLESTVTFPLQKPQEYPKTIMTSRDTTTTKTTGRNDHHQEPIDTNIMNMHEDNPQEKGAK